MRRSRSTAGLICAIAAAACLAGGATARQAPPTPAGRPLRIVSMNVCVDQYLMLLADPGQIVALSRFARDPTMSYYADRARRLPVSRSTVEEILALRPDLVFASPYRSRGALAPLEKNGARILEIGGADRFEEAVAQIRTVAAAVGHVDRGEAIVSHMRRDLAEVEARPKARGVAAYYQRRGYLTGEGTLVDEMMVKAGLTNLAAKQGLGALAHLPLEAIVQARPDFLIIEEDAARQSDNGTAMLFHPALDRVVPPARRLVIPQSMTVCSGPFYAEAVERLRAQAVAAANSNVAPQPRPGL